MSDNWFKRFMRKNFPSASERHEDGCKWGLEHFKGAKTEAEAEYLYEGLPLEMHDPFDEGIKSAYRTHLSIITTFENLGPRPPGPGGENIPAWAKAPIPPNVRPVFRVKAGRRVI